VSGLLQMSSFICLLLEAFPLAPTRWRTFNVGHANAIKHRLKAILMADVIAVALLWCVQNVSHANAIKDRHKYKSIYIRRNWHFDYLLTFAWPATIHQIGHPAGASIQPMLFWTCGYPVPMQGFSCFGSWAGFLTSFYGTYWWTSL
jgi:hypothetical protein